MDTAKPTGLDITYAHTEAMIKDRILWDTIQSSSNVSLAEKRIKELERIKTELYQCFATYPNGLLERVGDDIDKAICHLNNCIHKIQGG